jgi:hypothetical protein
VEQLRLSYDNWQTVSWPVSITLCPRPPTPRGPCQILHFLLLILIGVLSLTRGRVCSSHCSQPLVQAAQAYSTHFAVSLETGPAIRPGTGFPFCRLSRVAVTATEEFWAASRRLSGTVAQNRLLYTWSYDVRCLRLSGTVAQNRLLYTWSYDVRCLRLSECSVFVVVYAYAYDCS